jgi:hypothetical protein
MVLHILQILDHVNMVRNAIDDVDIPKIVQALAGKVIAFKTPRHVFLLGTLTKAVSALQAGGGHVV